MKTFIFKHKNKINILFPVIITICIFYSGNLGQRISEILTIYTVDAITLNNSFIILDIKASIQDGESFQKIKNNIGEQIEQLNDKWDNLEKEAKIKENKKLWLDRITYVLTLLLIIFNVALVEKSYYSDPNYLDTKS